MNDYDFSQLNDKEFEEISLDLISIERSQRYERFKAGRDEGIDGRYYISLGKQEVVQCKHYLKTGYKGLISSLKKKNNGINEIDKVRKLKPEKYIFITSLELTAKNKQEIMELFDPYIKKPQDIYSQSDLNDLLSSNDDIEEKYYKLWISSTNVLNRILHNAIKGRSEFLAETIQHKAKYYVETKDYKNVVQMLRDNHVVIIAGEPGIGKTTLAQQVALRYILKDFEFYVIEDPINEAESMLQLGKKQIFYFDDFLGSNFLDAIESKKDSHIVNFIERIKKDNQKRFILTSRTNIFNQSLSLSDTMKSSKIQNNELVIDIKNLGEIEKAKIFYNHIWHSGLKEEYIDELYIEKRYRHVVRHKNYNPRIIEYITKDINEETVKSADYWKFVIDKLDNPKDVWRQTFDRQSDDFIRSLVILVVFNGNTIQESDLKIAYEFYIKHIGLVNPSSASKDFETIIEDVIKYFLTRTIFSKSRIDYSLFNPSIADFVINRYQSNYNILFAALFSLKNHQSLKKFIGLYPSLITKDIYLKVLKNLYEQEDFLEGSPDYIIRLLSMVESTELYHLGLDISKKNDFLEYCIKKQKKVELNDVVFSLIEDSSITIPLDSLTFLKFKVINLDTEIENANDIIEVVKKNNINDDELFENLNDLIHDSIVQKLDAEITEFMLEEDDVTSYQTYDGVEADVKDDIVENFLKDTLDDIIKEIDSYDNLNIDRASINMLFDIDDIKSDKLNDFFENIFDDYDEIRDSGGHRSIQINNVDDVFER